MENSGVTRRSEDARVPSGIRDLASSACSGCDFSVKEYSMTTCIKILRFSARTDSIAPARQESSIHVFRLAGSVEGVVSNHDPYSD